MSRILSLVFAVPYVAVLLSRYGLNRLTVAALLLAILSLALIWFPEQMSRFSHDIGRSHTVATETPAIFASIAGWIFLVGVPLGWYFFIQ